MSVVVVAAAVGGAAVVAHLPCEEGQQHVDLTDAPVSDLSVVEAAAAVAVVVAAVVGDARAALPRILQSLHGNWLHDTRQRADDIDRNASTLSIDTASFSYEGSSLSYRLN